MQNKFLSVMYFVCGYFLSACLMLEGSKFYHGFAGMFLFFYLTYQLSLANTND